MLKLCIEIVVADDIVICTVRQDKMAASSCTHDSNVDSYLYYYIKISEDVAGTLNSRHLKCLAMFCVGICFMVFSSVSS